MKIKRKILMLLMITLGLCLLNNIVKNKNEIIRVRRDINYTEKAVYPEDILGVKVKSEIIEVSRARPGVKRTIKYIVIHETDNYNRGVGAKNHAIFLKNNNTSATSWHYTVDDKEIYHHVPDNEIAHHVGDKAGNYYGIGIELCVNKDGNFENTFHNGAKLVAYLIKEYGLDITSIKMHHHFIDKDCPNKILKDKRFLEFKGLVRKYFDDLS